MDIEEAYEKLNISPEEVAAVKNYLSFEHTGINILGDLTPENYTSLAKASWLLPSTENGARETIDKFVKIYSAMYKESLNKSASYTTRLVRGTSNKRAKEIEGHTSQFFSMSTDVSIAKTFCEYSDAALIRFNVENGVPFLNAENYRSENRKNEKEIIIAPFSKVNRNVRNYEEDGYTYYSVSIGKPELIDIPDEELAKMQEEVITGFPQNVEDIQEYMRAIDEYEVWNYRYTRATDKEEINYCENEMQKAKIKREEILQKVNEFRTKLQTTLKGLCRQKEREIDTAKEVIDEDKRIREEQKKQKEEAERLEKEKREKDLKRKAILVELTEKIGKEPEIKKEILDKVSDKYEGLTNIENIYGELAQKLQIGYTKRVQASSISQKIEELKKNISEIEAQTSEIKLSADTSLEEAEDISKKIKPFLDGIEYANEIVKANPDVVQMYASQSEREIKRNLCLKVHTMIREAKVQKLLKEKENIENEKVGFFGRMTGKDKIKELRLQNNKLKLQDARTRLPDEKSENSITEILTDIYEFKTKDCDGGELPPQLQNLFLSIRSAFKRKGDREFSDEFLSQCVNRRESNFSR